MINPAIKVSTVNSGPNHVAFLNSLNNLEEGVVSFRVRPDYNAHFGIVAYDIMSAMGARDDVSGRGGKSKNTLDLPVWLVANEIADVIVCGAEGLSVEVLHDLAATAFLTRTTFWFVFDHELPERLLEAVAEWCPEPIDEGEFNAYWKWLAETRSARPELEEVGVWPRQLPHEEFPLFLAEVRRQLPTGQADVVEEEFRSTVAIGRERISELEPVTEEALASILRDQLKGSSHPAQTLTRIRGFQVAAFHLGYLLKVDHAALLASELADFHSAVSDPESWKLLRAYRQPFRGAVNACLAAGVEVEDAPTIKVGEVSTDGASITTGGRRIEVPSGAEVFLRALLLQRLADGAGPEAQLFYDYSKGPQKAFLLVRALNASARELGVGLVTSRLKRHGGKARSWQTRHGVGIEELNHKPEVANAQQ